MGKPIKLDRDGVPVDPNDWTVDDWRDLHFGMIAIKASIAERHKPKANSEGANSCQPTAGPSTPTSG